MAIGITRVVTINTPGPRGPSGASAFPFQGDMVVSGSLTVSGSYVNFLEAADGVKGFRPYATQSSHFTCSLSDAGYYFRCGALTASIANSSTVPFALGTEIEFFQTSSAGNTYISSSHADVVINSKSGNLKLTGQFSAATIKKVGTDEWDLVGDLG